MPKELYLYSPIVDFVAQDLIQAIDENMGENITIRENCPGGSVFSNYGICAKIAEHGNVTIKVDGAAMSSGANLLPYAKKVTCLDVSTFLLHRADMYVESEEDKSFLAKINDDLKAKLLLKVDKNIFKEVTGVSINEMFDSEKRIDVILNAQQAKKIGLVDSITKLMPADVTAFNNKMFSVAASVNEQIITNINQKTNNMTIDKLKAEHPALFAEIIALGVAQEKDRVEACLAFVDIDPKAVKAAIESGKNLSQKQMADFALKAMSVKTLESIAVSAAASTPTSEVDDKIKTEKQKLIEAFEKSLDSHLKLKTV